MKTIGITGGGVMGSTLIGALKKTFSGFSILLFDRNPAKIKSLVKKYKVKPVSNNAQLADADIIILAVKPQDFKNVSLRISADTLVVSVMAGVSVATISRHLGTKKIIRAMPNTPARFGKGFTAWYATKSVLLSEIKFAGALFETMGTSLRMKTENEIDKATAITGSGPAYLLTALAHFINGAEKLGFSTAVAQLMIKQVLAGTQSLVEHEPNLGRLIGQVASKGGTTEAALKVFKSRDIERIWTEATRAAFRRAQALSRGK